MTHKRKDTFATPIEWRKHLRPYFKKRMAKKERVAAQRLISSEKTAK